MVSVDVVTHTQHTHTHTHTHTQRGIAKEIELRTNVVSTQVGGGRRRWRRKMQTRKLPSAEKRGMRLDLLRNRVNTNVYLVFELDQC